MRVFDLLVIIALVVFWYGLVPVAGSLVSRHSWRVFRLRFNALRRAPLLDYEKWYQSAGAGQVYRFMGKFESGGFSDGGDQIVWVQNSAITVPVVVRDLYLLSGFERGNYNPDEGFLEKVKWSRLRVPVEGAKVFVGGAIVEKDGRRVFASTREHPLLLIFYDGPDTSLPLQIMSASRNKNDYWNNFTPYALVLGAFSLIMMALSFFQRPAFRLTVFTAFIAVFAPLFPYFPPGVLLTALYRRLWKRSRFLRTYRDIARLFLTCSTRPDTLPDGTEYGSIRSIALPENAPLLIPEKGNEYYFFGELRNGTILQPADPCAIFGVLPGKPEKLVETYAAKAAFFEVMAWLALLLATGVTVFFIATIMTIVLY